MQEIDLTNAIEAAKKETLPATEELAVIKEINQGLSELDIFLRSLVDESEIRKIQQELRDMHQSQ